jgi:hypothetical protein
LKIDSLNEEDFRRIEKDRQELNSAYDNVRESASGRERLEREREKFNLLIKLNFVVYFLLFRFVLFVSCSLGSVIRNKYNLVGIGVVGERFEMIGSRFLLFDSISTDRVFG